MKKLIKYKILECVFLIITVILLIFLFNYVIKLKEHDNLLILLTDTGEESLYAEFAYWDISYKLQRWFDTGEKSPGEVFDTYYMRCSGYTIQQWIKEFYALFLEG